jgi:hypothetical protein
MPMFYKDKIQAILSCFHNNEGGTIAIMSALLIIPIMIAIGISVDYARASRLKNRLQIAADLAVLSSLTPFSKISKPEEEARSFFLANISARDAALVKDITVTYDGAVNRGQTITISFTAEESSSFLKIADINFLAVGGSSSAKIAPYPGAGIYFLVDTSQSMGVVSTEAGRLQLRAATMTGFPGGSCELACHGSRLAEARRIGVELRIDVAKSGVDRVLQLAGADQQQIKFSIYSLSNNMVPVISEESDLAKVKTALDRVDMGYNETLNNPNSNDDSNTFFDISIPAVVNDIVQKSQASGTMDAPGFIFLVTDGLQSNNNGRAVYSPSGQPTGDHTRIPNVDDTRIIDKKYCDMLKQTGKKLAVIYTEYISLAGDYAYDYHVAPIHDQIEPSLRACASDPSLFAHGSSPDEIRSAFEHVYGSTFSPLRLAQ